MKLEDEIQQIKGFTSEHQKALVNIMFTNGWAEEKLRMYLKPFDLTQQQFNVLRILRGSLPKPLSTSCIRTRMIDKMSDASRIVDRLCKKQLVIRIQSPVDRRLVEVRISEKGLALLDAMDGEQLDHKTIVNLSNEELVQLNSLLDKLRG
jgi:DNA-binding MarR family transcriptional regulator